LDISKSSGKVFEGVSLEYVNEIYPIIPLVANIVLVLYNDGFKLSQIVYNVHIIGLIKIEYFLSQLFY